MPSTFPTITSATASGKPVGSATSLLEAFMREEPEERAAALESVANSWKTAHRRLWNIWSECAGFCFSDQYGSYDAERGTWRARDPAPEKKVTRISVNHMAPIAEDVASLQCLEPPNLRATSPNDGSAPASASQTADQLLYWLWDIDGYDDKNVTLRHAAAVFGNWFLMPLWDAEGGRLVETLSHYEPVAGPPDLVTGMPTSMGMKPVMKKVREGKFADRLVSCFDALPDPASKEEWDGEGFIVHERLPLAYLRRTYPKYKDKLVTDRGTGANDGTYFTENLKGASPKTGGMMGSSSAEHSAETVSVYTVFLRSCEEFYRGREAVVACGVMLYEGDNRVYPNEEEEAKGEEFPAYHWPVFRFMHNEVPGSYWGQGIAVRLIDIQKKLNGIASKILHMLKRISHPTLVKPKGADFVKTDEPDQQINVARDLQPGSIYYLQSPQFPQELPQEERNAVDQMEKIAGINSGSRGQSEGGDSGTKVRQLFQRDLGRLAVPKQRSDRQLALAFTYKLVEWRRRATTARTVRIVGENNTTSVKQFSAASIGPKTDVIVYSDSQMPRDPSARGIHIEKAIQLGIIDPKDPVQRAEVAQLMGFGMSEKQFESALAADRKRAMVENLKMYDGETCPVEFWHDDLQDLSAHFSEMNTERWIIATTPKPDDPPDLAMRKQMVRKLYTDHVQSHMFAIKVKSGLAAPAPGPGQMPGGPSPSGAPPAGPPPMAAGPAPSMDLSQAPPVTPEVPAGPPGQKMAA